LIHFSNFGCGTEVDTVEKEINTRRVDTKEMASQIIKEYKEASCDNSI
jgi:hypothetical protein